MSEEPASTHTVFEEAGITSEQAAEAPTPENEVDVPDYNVDPQGPTETPPQDSRPDWLPEKFTSPQELVDAYNQMGKKIRDVQQGRAPDAYEIQDSEGKPVELSKEDEERYKKMGLTNDQVQELETYFESEVLPQLNELKVNQELERLASLWGTEKNSSVFKERMKTLHDWAGKNLPPEVLQEMGRSASGIHTLQSMMDKGYSAVNTDSPSPRYTKVELESMTQDERYWTDPAFREKVDQAFRQTYGA